MVDGKTTGKQAPRAARNLTAPYERSFPLIALVQLATFCAALAMCVDGARLREVLDAQGNILFWDAEAWLVVAAAPASAGVVGVLLGAAQLRMWRSAALGAAIGGLAGLTLLTIYVAPASFAHIAAGAAMVLVTTIAFRIRSA